MHAASLVTLFGSLWSGVALRAAPRPFAKSCGQLNLGQYVCGVEREGLWLRLATDQSRDGRDGHDGHEANEQWVCVEDRGKALLEPVRDADMGSATVPQEEPLADKFDRPFEPRLQAPDFEKPEVTRHQHWHDLGGNRSGYVWFSIVLFDTSHCLGSLFGGSCMRTRKAKYQWTSRPSKIKRNRQEVTIRTKKICWRLARLAFCKACLTRARMVNSAPS